MDIQVSLSEEIKEVAPNLKLGLIIANVKVTEHSQELWQVIASVTDELVLETSDIAKIPAINAGRKAYRALGKDPTRYRLSSDSLMRRIVKAQGLYKVNDVVDINNLLSLESGHSIGTYDLDKIQGPIVYGIGTAEEEYRGIGRGPLNIEGLPVFKDDEGSFGSATSDSERTMVTTDTKTILMNIIAFDGDAGLKEWMDKAAGLLETYASGQVLKQWIVA